MEDDTILYSIMAAVGIVSFLVGGWIGVNTMETAANDCIAFGQAVNRTVIMSEGECRVLESNGLWYEKNELEKFWRYNGSKKNTKDKD